MASPYMRDEDGSPPRVRGTDRRFQMEDAGLRITPACAGNRRSFSISISSAGITPACAGNSYDELIRRQGTEDHPRVCGEQNTAFSLVQLTVGSPPRVRGTDVGSSFLVAGRGITPACAGNSF